MISVVTFFHLIQGHEEMMEAVEQTVVAAAADGTQVAADHDESSEI
jgi:hypothetical protein